MKEIKWLFLFYAVGTTVSLAGVGIAFAERSMVGVVTCMFLAITLIGVGFMTKKKMRKKNLL